LSGWAILKHTVTSFHLYTPGGNSIVEWTPERERSAGTACIFANVRRISLEPEILYTVAFQLDAKFKTTADFQS